MGKSVFPDHLKGGYGMAQGWKKYLNKLLRVGGLRLHLYLKILLEWKQLIVWPSSEGPEPSLFSGLVLLRDGCQLKCWENSHHHLSSPLLPCTAESPLLFEHYFFYLKNSCLKWQVHKWPQIQFLHCSRPWLPHLLEATLRLHPVVKHRHGFLDPERVRSWTKGTERPKLSGIWQLLYWWPDLDSWPVLWAICPSSGFLIHLSYVSTYLFNQDSHIIPAQKSGQLWFWPAMAQGYFLAGRPLPGRPRLVLPFPGESVYEGPACSSWASSALREETCCRSRHLPVSHTAPSAETKQKVLEPKGSASYEPVCSLRAKKWVLCVCVWRGGQLLKGKLEAWKGRGPERGWVNKTSAIQMELLLLF